MSRLGNALTMIELLSSGKKYSVEELAERLEVTPRMIRKYKEDIEQSGIYIDTIRGPYGGYVLNQSISLPRRKFKKSDYEFLNQLEVGDEKRARLNEIADKVRGIYLGSKEETAELTKETRSIYNTFVKAIKEKRKVRITYYSYTKGETERIIHPFDLFLTSSGWGCAAFCELRGDLRHFELRRIQKCEILEEMFN